MKIFGDRRHVTVDTNISIYVIVMGLDGEELDIVQITCTDTCRLLYKYILMDSRHLKKPVLRPDQVASPDCLYRHVKITHNKPH